MFSFLRRAQRPPRPVVLDVDTTHPVMRSEAASQFAWLDLASAEDEIARRARRGALTRAEASALRHWAEHGYVVLEGCVSGDACDRILEDLDAVWNERRHLCIDVLTDGRRTFVDEVDPAVRSVPYKLNDHYLHSAAVREVFLNERIVRFAELVFERSVVGCNSLTFERGTQQPAHIDHVYMTPTPARRLVASWVALEDVRSEAGPLLLWPGSHRLPPFDFGGSYHYTPELDSDHTRYVAEQKERFERREFLARKGDVLLWHALFVHGGAPIVDPGATRKSMAFHYFSTEVVSETSEAVKRHGRAYYLAKDA